MNQTIWTIEWDTDTFSGYRRVCELSKRIDNPNEVLYMNSWSVALGLLKNNSVLLPNRVNALGARTFRIVSFPDAREKDLLFKGRSFLCQYKGNREVYISPEGKCFESDECSSEREWFCCVLELSWCYENSDEGGIKILTSRSFGKKVMPIDH